MKNGESGFIDVASGLKNTRYEQTIGISSGNTYEFKVKARNKVDFSQYSPTLDIIAATEPQKPEDMARNNDLTDTSQVSFSWNAPKDDGGS